jgi:hypothetical protein
MLELAGETTKIGCRQGQFSQLTVLWITTDSEYFVLRKLGSFS